MQKLIAFCAASAERGMALGPLMFVIAVLGVLAASIAASSGSFSSSTTSEGDRVKASALIEIGETLKVGFDRITQSSMVAFDDVVIHANNTIGDHDLFAAQAGGISPPSIALANDPTSDVWYYPVGNYNGLGGSSAVDRLAVLPVSKGVCDEINNKANGFLSTPAGADVGNFKDVSLPDAKLTANWPSVLRGRTAGCVNNTNTASQGTYFFQVIGIR